MKQYFYRLRYWIGGYSLRGFIHVVPWLPRRLLFFITSGVVQLTVAILWKYRVRMEENISMVMGEEIRSPEERKALARAAWNNFALSFYETIYALNISKENICSTVSIRGEENLKRALTKGKGIIGLSAHLGNFSMIGVRLAAGGYPFSAVVKQPRDQGFAQLMDEYRLMKGIKTISAKPRRVAARGILTALRKNRIVLLIADEFKGGGVEVEFMGRTVHAPRGPVTLALRTGAPVLPIFVTRDREYRLTLHIGSEIDLVKTGDLQSDVVSNTAEFVRQIETMVRSYPDQWSWLGFRSNGKRPTAKWLKPQAPSPKQEKHKVS